MNSIQIDFLSKKLAHRRKSLSLKKETLARALGLKGPSTLVPPRIIDATAGLAQDSFILACLGFEVTLLERSPVVHTLIEEGMQRAKQDAALAPTISRMHLIHTDSINYLAALKPNERPELIYLDPMFPERKKSALSKKEMRILHEIVGEDLDENQLLRVALACATKRVVVKRPRLAEPVDNMRPTYSLIGSSSRFDIYQTGT